MGEDTERPDRSGNHEPLAKLKALLPDLEEAGKSFDDVWMGQGGPRYGGRVANVDQAIFRLVLELVGNIRFTRPFEKVLWACKFTCLGHTFHFAVTKMSGLTGTIAGDTAEHVATYKEFMGRMTAACRLLRKDLVVIGRSELEAGRGWIENRHWHLNSLYKWHRDKVDAALAVLAEPPDSSASAGKTADDAIQKISEAMNRRSRALFETDRYGLAAVAFFFGWLDLFLEAYNLLAKRQPVPLVELRQVRLWTSRVAKVLPLESSQQLQNAFSELTWCKKNVRDVSLHGYSSDDSILFSVGSRGLFRLHDGDVGPPLRQNWQPFSGDVAERALAGIDSMLAWIETDDDAWKVIRYLDTGANVALDRSEDVRREFETTTRQEWAASMEDLGNRVDDMRNFDF